MPIPIGFDITTGALVNIASPNEVRALELFQQLEAWRARGYDPQLWGTPDGWGLILDMTKWGQYDISERSRKMMLRFVTDTCATPEAAIEAALKVIQP